MNNTQQHYDTVLKIAVGAMIVASAIWLGYETWRFFWVPERLFGISIHPGAIDLRNRYQEVQAWFSYHQVYSVVGTAVYPPASYALMGIVLWWLDLGSAKFIWYLGSILAIVWLSRQLVSHSLAENAWERRLIALVPFAVYATGATIGNGQLIAYVLPLVLWSVFQICRDDASVAKTWLGALAMLLALVQPTIAAPFFWLVLFVPGRIKPAALVVGGYLLLTSFAIFFQLAHLETVYMNTLAKQLAFVEFWSDRAADGAYWGSLRGGYANLHSLLTDDGLSSWNFRGSLFILMLFGGWVFFYRKVDLWLLVGVTAIVARLWVYHRWYDDLLLVLPLIALFRINKLQGYTKTVKTAAGSLFSALLTLSLAPGGFYVLPAPWLQVYIYALVGCWLGVLVLLVYLTHQEWRALRVG